MERVTKEKLEGLIARLTKLMRGKNTYNLRSYSPGDGWTRFYITKNEDDGKYEREVSPYMNKKEMQAYLRGAIDFMLEMSD